MTELGFDEFALEGDGTPVDISKLRKSFLSNEDYALVHANSVIPCHDVYIEVPDEKGNLGLLLVERKEEPCKGLLWPVGGAVARGMTTEESLRKKARDECGLELDDIRFLGFDRVFFERVTLGHGKGYDAFGLNFYAKGSGELKLNDLHQNPTIMTLGQFMEPNFRAGLHPYMDKHMYKAFGEMVKKYPSSSFA